MCADSRGDVATVVKRAANGRDSCGCVSCQGGVFQRFSTVVIEAGAEKFPMLLSSWLAEFRDGNPQFNDVIHVIKSSTPADI